MTKKRLRENERESVQITASHLSFKGDNGEDQNQQVYVIINSGYCSILEIACWFDITAGEIKYI